MTRYTVVWAQAAEDELVNIWLEGDDRNDVTAATQAIDRELQTEPTRRVSISPKGYAA